MRITGVTNPGVVKNAAVRPALGPSVLGKIATILQIQRRKKLLHYSHFARTFRKIFVFSGRRTMFSRFRRLSPYAFRLVTVFVLYFAAGKLGLAAPFTSGNVSPFWPASGIALASVLLWGNLVWPAIAAAAFLVNFWSPIPARAAAGIAVGNTSAALVGGFLLRRVGRLNLGLERLRDVIALLALGALVSPLVAAAIGTITLSLAHVKAWSGLATALPVWWFGDAMGILIAAPLVLTASQAVTLVQRSNTAELASLFAGTVVTTLLIFGQALGYSVRDDVLAFALFPFVMWAAIRFRLIGAALICLAIAMIAVWGTAHGKGPFVSHEPVHNAVLLQLFVAVLSISGLALSAVISERTRAESALRSLSGRLMRLQDDERRRLARELHDSSGQHLVALQMNLSALGKHIPRAEADCSSLLFDCQQILNRVVKEIRTLSYLLHPPLLDETGLRSALQWYVDGLAQRSNVKIELHLAEDLGRLSQELETAIFRIVQEGLTNIHRHSGSAIARISLVARGDQVVLTIRDEGTGVRPELLGDPAANSSSFGVGIRGITERVRELRGRIRIKNATPGTIVKVVLPLEGREPGRTADIGARGVQN
jgi:two-component system, NarL family, sensor histidine kinase FusK